MVTPSWLFLPQESPVHQLPEELRAKDNRLAVDCGWVEQMVPFINDLSNSGNLVLDPFAGFGSTLVACALTDRKALGIEISAERIDIIQQRMTRYPSACYELIHGDSSCTTLDKSSIDLCLTNVPYFELPHDQSRLAKELSYQEFLEKQAMVWANTSRAMKNGTFLVAMVQNLRLGGKFVPFAWDTARQIARFFTLCEERVLCYPPRESGAHLNLSAVADITCTTRSHEYALVARRDYPEIDINQAFRLLHEIHRHGVKLVLFGGLALNLVAPECCDRKACDIDILIKADPPDVTHFVLVMQQLGFVVTSWGEPVTLPLSASHYTNRFYFRASKENLTLDATFSTAEQNLEKFASRATQINGISVACLADLKTGLKLANRPRDRARLQSIEAKKGGLRSPNRLAPRRFLARVFALCSVAPVSSPLAALLPYLYGPYPTRCQRGVAERPHQPNNREKIE